MPPSRYLLPLLLIGVISAEKCVDRLEWTTFAGNILVNGEPFVLKGVSYSGFETDTAAPHGIWDHSLDRFLDFIQNNNFNAIRLPFSLALVKVNPGTGYINCDENRGLCDLNGMELMDAFIDRAASRGLLIMLDNHRITHNGGISALWYNDEYPESEVIRLWKKLVDRYRNKWNVFAVDLKNEVHDSASWGDSKARTDWNKAAERIIKGISSFRGLYFVGGTEWGTRLSNVWSFPINTGSSSLNNRVVYSPHCYGPDVYNRSAFSNPDFPNNLGAVYDSLYGYIPKQTGQPVVVGEWGGRMRSGTKDEQWNKWYVEWLRGKCLTNNFYWALNPNSGDTGGLLENDWTTPVTRKLNLVNRLQPSPTKFKARNGKICITPGQFPEANCRNGGGGGGGSGLRPTTPPRSGGGSSGGVSATAVFVKGWVENGKGVHEYKLRIKNDSAYTVCYVDVKLRATLKNKWNLNEISTDVYQTPDWMKIKPGQASDQAGFIAYGDSTAQVITVRRC